MYDLKVVIIGAGMGGLTTGIALKQAGYQVEIFDRTRELRPAGAGISLWSNGIKVLSQLGLGREIAAIGGEMNRMEYRSHRDEPLCQVDLRPLFQRVGQRPYPVSRTELQQMLLDAFGPEQVHLRMKCVAVKQNKTSAMAIFEDGSQVSGDVLIGADGLRSTVREHVLQEVSEQPLAPRYADYVNWNGLVPVKPELCEADNWVLYVGEGKRASMMPVGGNRFYFFFGVPMVQGSQTSSEDIRAELAQHFSDWPQPVQTLIQTLDPNQTNRLEICDIDPPARLVRGRIALLGDSGHATTPTLGQGGCQAMEDAVVLTRYLVTTNISVADALQRYEQARQERTAQLTLKARKRTDMIYGKDPAVTQQWYQELRQDSPEVIINALANTILGGPLG